MTEFLVWAPDQGEVESDGREVEAESAEAAALAEGKRRWADDYPAEQVFSVSELLAGNVKTFTVYAAPSIEFRVQERPA